MPNDDLVWALELIEDLPLDDEVSLQNALAKWRDEVLGVVRRTLSKIAAGNHTPVGPGDPLFQKGHGEPLCRSSRDARGVPAANVNRNGDGSLPRAVPRRFA